MTTKVHLACDGRGLPLAVLVTPGNRNVVERCFNRLKQFRAIATRFDKLADRYRAGVHLAALILWLREPSQDRLSDNA